MRDTAQHTARRSRRTFKATFITFYVIIFEI